MEFVGNSLTNVYRSHFESPIEELLFEAILMWVWVHNRGVVGIKGEFKKARYQISPQQEVAGYRADFVLVDTKQHVSCVIEADGHDFHERTKEQASRDRSRDREVQALGFLILRFTGSEIWADPWKCAAIIFDAIDGCVSKRDGIEMHGPYYQTIVEL